MYGTGWVIGMGVLYLVLLFTMGMLCFRKGHWILGLIGFVFPFSWLFGAVLPGRRQH